MIVEQREFNLPTYEATPVQPKGGLYLTSSPGLLLRLVCFPEISLKAMI